MESASQTLARHVVRTSYDDLPAPAIDAAKWFLLDTIGVAWAGTGAPGADALRRTVLADRAGGDCTEIASDRRLPPTSAALLNGMYAGALDFDGVYEKGSVHPDIVTLPAALAIAEQQHASGRDLLTALALGNDISCRSGGAMTGNRGWFNTATHGVFGGAAAASKLLRLEADQTTDALGLAFSQAAGSQQALVEKSLVKRMLSGMAARAAVFAALAAQQGVSAPKEVFEGPFGFHTLYGDGACDTLLEGLGERYENADTVTKKYPSCTANHVAIEAALALRDAHGLTADDIDQGTVTISPFMDGLVGGPFDPADNPQVAAQFSVQYSVACAIVRGRLGITEIQDDVIADPSINALARKISVRANEDWPGKFAPCDLHIRTVDGRDLDHHTAHTPGSPENPMSLGDLKNKFRDCTASGVRPLSDAQCDRAIETILNIEDAADISGVFAFQQV